MSLLLHEGDVDCVNLIMCDITKEAFVRLINAITNINYPVRVSTKRVHHRSHRILIFACHYRLG